MDKSTKKFNPLDRVVFTALDGDKIDLQVLSEGTWNFQHHDWEYSCMSNITYEKVYVTESNLELQ